VFSGRLSLGGNAPLLVNIILGMKILVSLKQSLTAIAERMPSPVSKLPAPGSHAATANENGRDVTFAIQI